MSANHEHHVNHELINQLGQLDNIQSWLQKNRLSFVEYFSGCCINN